METQSDGNRVDISACLEAVSMYNADLHLKRDNYNPSAPPAETQLVSPWVHLCSQIAKMGTNLLGVYLIVAACIAGGIMLGNIVKNVYDVDRAEPTVYTETLTDPVTHHIFTNTRMVPSLYPLPDDYWQINIRIYEILVLGIVVCGLGSRFSLRRSNEIRVGVPLTPANTAHLPAADSLVRASSEPFQAQQAVLLRAAAHVQEKHEEQLLRAVNGQG